MIARIWRSWAIPKTVALYRQHFVTTVRPHIETLPGFRGCYLLEQAEAEEVEIIVITLWESVAAIAAFTGPDTRRAVVEDQAAAVLTRYNTTADHYQVSVAVD